MNNAAAIYGRHLQLASAIYSGGIVLMQQPLYTFIPSEPLRNFR